VVVVVVMVMVVVVVVVVAHVLRRQCQRGALAIFLFACARSQLSQVGRYLGSSPLQ
jgi:hypothetical protein